MFDEIHNHPSLYGIVRGSCEENNVEVGIDPTLSDENILILKPDEYYSSTRTHNPPPAPDCLVLVHCSNKQHYDLYLIELKNVKNTQDLKYKMIVKKFKTMIDEFFVEFEVIFDKVSYGVIKFYLITPYPKGAENLSVDEYRKKIKGCALDVYASQKPLKLYNKAILIEPKARLTIPSC